LGRAWLIQGQAAEAAKALADGLRLKPGDARAHNVRAVALAAMRQYSDAAQELQLALALEPENQIFRENLGCLERRLYGCELKP
jgi:Flp pilus assembly protein TadD